jgi:hypothetical protein
MFFCLGKSWIEKEYRPCGTGFSREGGFLMQEKVNVLALSRLQPVSRELWRLGNCRQMAREQTIIHATAHRPWGMINAKGKPGG